MKEILNRLHENRQIELAKSILESNGYKVTKRLKESYDGGVLFSEFMADMEDEEREFYENMLSLLDSGADETRAYDEENSEDFEAMLDRYKKIKDIDIPGTEETYAGSSDASIGTLDGKKALRFSDAGYDSIVVVG